VIDIYGSVGTAVSIIFEKRYNSSVSFRSVPQGQNVRQWFNKGVHFGNREEGVEFFLEFPTENSVASEL
jgi:hypothetical protein